jgi:hypothetical protein
MLGRDLTAMEADWLSRPDLMDDQPINPVQIGLCYLLFKFSSVKTLRVRARHSYCTLVTSRAIVPGILPAQFSCCRFRFS